MVESPVTMSEWRDISDDDVVAACEGNGPARERVLVALEPRVRASIIVRAGNRLFQSDGVGDLTDNVIVGVIEGLPGLRNRTRRGLLGFTSIVTRNKVSDWNKQDIINKQQLKGSSFWVLMGGDGTSVVSAVNRAQLFEAFMWALERVRPSYRDILVLTVIEGLNTREAAERLGITRENASVRLKRAWKTVRKKMQEWKPTEEDDGAPD